MTQGENDQWWDKTGHHPLPADDIVADYYDGLGVPRLSYKYSSSLIVIRALLRAHGVVLQPGRARRLPSDAPIPPPPVADVAPVEPPSAAVGMVRDWVSIDVHEAMSMLWAGRSLDEVAEHFDAKTSSFCEVMHRASTEFRRYRRSLAQARSHEDWLRRREEEQRARQERLRERERKAAERERKAAEREREREERKRHVARVAAEQRRQNERERQKRAAAARRVQEERDEQAHEEELERQQNREAEERRQEELRNRVYELYEQGWTSQGIADHEGISRPVARKLLEEWGVDKPRWAPVTDTAIEDCWHDLEFVDYARGLQVSAQQTRGWTPPDSPLRRASEELAELLAMSVQAGVPAKFMADQLGVTHGAVRMRISRHGYAEMMPSQGGVHYGERAWVRNTIDDRETCKHGHAWIDENIYVSPSGTKVCIPCDRRRRIEYLDRKRKRAEATAGVSK